MNLNFFKNNKNRTKVDVQNYDPEMVDSILELMFWIRFTNADIVIFENLKYQKIDVLETLIKNKDIIFYYYIPKKNININTNNAFNNNFNNCLFICGFNVFKDLDYYNNLFKSEVFSYDQKYILNELLKNITLEDAYFKHHIYNFSNPLFLDRFINRIGLSYSMKYLGRL